MRNPFRIMVAILILAMVGGVVWQVLRRHEPVYQGKTFGYWMKQPGILADSNAVPFLVDVLETRDGPLRKAYAVAWLRSPPWVQKRLKPPADRWVTQTIALEFLGRIGTNSPAAMSALIRASKEGETPFVRQLALRHLAQTGGTNINVKAAFVEAVKDKDPNLRNMAASWLRQIDPEAAAKAGVE
jgi:hypothetical protein